MNVKTTKNADEKCHHFGTSIVNWYKHPSIEERQKKNHNSVQGQGNEICKSICKTSKVPLFSSGNATAIFKIKYF